MVRDSWNEVRPEARLWTGDALAGLQTLPDASVQCCVTSPPYYGLRAYLPAGHADKALEVGAEETPDDYVAKLVAVFREVRRVLRDDGTCWVNLGDSYASGGRTSRAPDAKDSKSGRMNENYRPQDPAWLKPKDLIGIPWMVAFALRADGWYLRQDIIWAKRNCMPESVNDRCTKAHEYVFLLTKRARYFFDADAVKEGSTCDRIRGPALHPCADTNGNSGLARRESDGFRNRRSVWTLASEPCAEAHFATMPSALAELCIRAGTPVHGCCAACGTPYVAEFQERESDGLVDYDGKWDEEDQQSSGRRLLARARAARMAGKGHDAPFAGRVVTGYKQSCACANAGTVPSTVFDPFTGSGTTGIVALRQDRRFVGCELNPEYAAMAARRIAAAGIQLALL